MGKQRSNSGVYEPLSPAENDDGNLDRVRLREAEARDRKASADARAKYLSKYDKDPLSQALAAAEYEDQKQEAQKAQRKSEYDKVVSKYDDPLSRSLAIAEHYSKQLEAPEAQKAFADNERVQRLKEEEANSRKLDNAGMGFAPLRETIGAAAQTTRKLASVVARVGEGIGLIPEKAADELNRESQSFGQASELSRQGDMLPYLSKMYGGAAESMMQMYATPGGAASKMIGAGVSTANDALTTAEDAGLEGAERLRFAGTQGLLESGIAFLGQKIFGPGFEARAAGQSVAANSWKQLGLDALKEGAKEVPEELVTTVLQDLSNKFQGVSPNLTVEDFISNAIDTVVQTGIMGGLMGAKSAAGKLLSGRGKKPPQLEQETLYPFLNQKEDQQQAGTPTIDLKSLENNGYGNGPKDLLPLDADPQNRQVAGLQNPVEPVENRQLAGSTDAPAPITPEELAFIENPSRKKYEAAVNAGMPESPNGMARDRRLKYAEERRQRLNQDLVATQDPAPLEPAPQEAPGTVPDVDEELFLRELNGGITNGQESNVQGQQVQQGQQEGYQGAPLNEGQQEELLTPAGTPNVTTPIESRIPPADHTRESFEKEYTENYIEMNIQPVDSPEYRALESRMADLYDAHPDWAQNLETTQPVPSVVGQTESGPGQSSPPATGPVSSSENQTSPVSPEPESDSTTTDVPQSTSKEVAYPESAPVIEDWFGKDSDRVIEWTKTDSPRTALKPKEYAAAYKNGVRVAAGPVSMVLKNAVDIVSDGKTERFFFGKGGIQLAVGIPRQRDGATIPAGQTISPATPTDSNQLQTTPVPAFAALPQKSQDLFNKAFESKDVESLKQMVQKNNVAWNSEFTNRTGIKLPKTQKGKQQAVSEWAKGTEPAPEQTKPVGSVIESPDLQLERKRTEDADTRKQAIKDGGFVVGDRVTQSSTGRQGVLEAISDKSGTVAVRFDEDNSVLSGTDVSGFVRGDVEKPKTQEDTKPDKSLYDMLKEVDELLDSQGRVKDDRLLKRRDELERLIQEEAKAETPPADSQPEPSQEDLMEAALREELLGEKPAKPAKERKPKPGKRITNPDGSYYNEPTEQKKPRTDAAKKRTERTAAELKAAEDDVFKAFRSTANMGLNKEQMTAIARLVKAALNHKVSTFNEFVAYVMDRFGEPMALQMAEGIELAWKTLRRLPDYAGIDEAGSVADVVKSRQAASSEPPARTLVDLLEKELLTNGGIEAKKLWELADKAYGGTRAEGKYGPSEAYDALETAINLTILDARAMGLKTPAGQVSPEIALKNLLDMQKQIVSQTNRSGTKDTMQQFSTPPAYSYVVSQFVNMDARDVVLEPSAGTGDLAVHALNQRAKVHVNELDPKRAEMLKAVQESAEDRLTISTEDALQLGNIMGPNLRPSVVLMNPPFSREGQRMGDKKMSGNDRNHIDAAMASLIDGGRLVAIIGAGLHGPSKGFTTWLAETAKKHNVRANIEVSRDVYKGYGTTFPTRVLVIDKGTPTPKDGTLTAQADSLEHLLTMTKGIRNDRNRGQIQPVAPGQNVPINAGENEGGQQSKVPDRTATAASDSGQPNGNASKRPAKAQKPTTGTGGNIVADDTRGRADNADSQGTRSQPSGSSKPISTATTDATGEPTGNLAGQSPEPRRVAEKRTEIDESVLFEPYQPSIVPFPNAKPHPTAAVESAAMAAVEYPEVTEVPNIDARIIDDGRLSDVQLEFVALAAHAHNQILPNEERTGILFGDGTGMGKGRGIPGVILHNWNEGRRKAIWMSKNGKLHSDAMREWEELGGNPAQVANLSDMPVDNAIDLDEGILFATYDTLKSSGKSGKTRESQVTDWLPADFDGVIAFDEAHLMGSDTAARAGVARQIQDKFPKARIVYASATAATEIDQLMFGSRLGLWGAATPFATAKEFAAKIGAAGVSAMESVALSLKAMGRYVSRSISFNDGTPDGTVGYKRLNHTLADHQVQMYDRLADAWQKVIGEFEDAMDATKADNQARGFARGQFWSAHQRFFNDLVTSLQMPTVIESIEKDLAEGRSVVIQLTTTGAAQQARALAGRGTQSLDDFAVDPFSSLVELVRSQFPTQAYENYMKDDGSIGKRRVVDSEGKPVKDAAAVAKQQQLLSDLADMEQSMPDSPIDMILNYFGTENVAEVTGRNQRVVWQEQQDGTKKRVLEKRSQKKSNQADIDAFQEGKKRILIFSQAGGTGASYHADRRARNQEKRMHYLVQPGWVAADAIQGLGRTHRTNQKQAPEYILVQTDIPGQKRFISTIARRLTQLGALTRGQRTAGGSGVFDASDNLESTEAALALTEFFKSLEKEDAVMSLDEFEAQTGLELRLPSTGAMKADGNLPDITSFMNRMLSMQVASQNKVFDEFDRMLKTITEARRLSGELDQGVETIKGSNIRKTRDEVVFTHDSGAKTRYVQLTMEVPIPSKDFDTQSKAEKYKDFIGYYKRKSDGKVFFVNESFSKTSKSGQVVEMIRLVPPYGEALREEAYKLNQGTLEKIQPADAEQLWNEQFSNRPKTKSQKVDMITGAVLPVWDRLPQQQPKLSRALTASGDMVLGVVLPPSKVNETLGKLGAEKNKVDVGSTIKMLREGKGDIQLVNGWKVQRVRVQNEWRLEIVGPNPVSEIVFQRQGVITERIGFKARYFIPFGENTQSVFDAVTRGNPIQNVNRYDAMDAGDEEESDTAEPTGTATPDPETGPSELRAAADKAKAELEAIREINAQDDKIINREWKNLGPATFAPLTPELLNALGRRIVGAIKAGAKSFEVVIREMRANIADDAMIGLKPNLIRAWNALQSKYDLEPATEERFDAAMSNDADVQKVIEAATGEQNRQVAGSPSTPTADPATPAAATMPAEEPDRLYSTQNAYSAAERVKLGMGDRPEVQTLSRGPSVMNAKEYGQTLAGSDFINSLITELSQYPRVVTPYENDLLNYRNAELGEKLEAALRRKNAAHKAGDDAEKAIAQTFVDNLRAQKKALIADVLEPIGTAAGRSLQARKAIINQDFTLQRMALEYESAYGDAPSDSQLAQFQEKIDALNAEIAKLEALNAEQAATIDDLQTKLKEAHESGVKEATAEQPEPAEPKQPSQRQRALDRIDTGRKKWRAMKGKVFSVETATAQAMDALFDIATGFAELGVVNLKTFLKRLRNVIGDEDADKYVNEATETWNKITSKTTEEQLDQITSKIDPTDDETIGRVARELHRFVIRRDSLDASDEGRNAAVVAVYNIMESLVPGITEDQVARAMSGIGVYSELNKDEIEVIRRDQKAQLMLLEQISDWKKAAADEAIEPGTGKAPPRTGPERPPVSDEQRALRKLVNEAKKAAGIVTTTEGQLRSALDAAKRLATNRISDLTKALEPGGKPISKNQKILKSDTELDALRAERDRLQKLYDEAFGKGQLTDEQRAIAAEKALDRAISGMESELASGKLYGEPKKPPVDSPAIEAKRAQLKALKALREEMRIDSGEAQARSDAAYERHLLEREAELAQRLASGNFAPIPKKPARELTPSMLKTMQSIEKMRQELRREMDKWEFENTSKVYQFLMKAGAGPVHVLRKGLTTFDQSLIGRQGYLLGIINPSIYGKAIKKAFGSDWRKGFSIFPTEQDLFNTQTELDADENWVRMEKLAKLAVTDVHGGVNREEDSVFMPEWVNKIPGVGGSERAGSAFINTQRRLVFRSLVDKLNRQVAGKRAISNSELRVIGNFVNISTGRGSLGKYANSLEAMTMLFFSPRWWASRLAWMSGQPIWHNTSWLRGEGASREVRTMVAVEMLKQGAAQMAIIGIAAAALSAAYGAGGDDEEWQFVYDPRNPDFGKLRIGRTMIDMTAGIGQHISVLARMFGTEVRRWEGASEAKTGTILLNYGRGKLAPIPSMVADFTSDNKKSMSGATAGSEEWFVDRFAPLIMQDVMKTTKEEGIPLGPVLSAMMFFGIGAQTREERVKARGDLANELRAAKKQGESPEKIQAIIKEHLKNAASTEAKEDLRTADPEMAAEIQKIIAGEASPELAAAMEKEKYDITLRAVELLSSEDRTKQKGSGEDKGIQTAREIIKQIAPTFEEANVLFTEAYRQRHGSPTELVGPEGKKRRQTKKSVAASRARLRAMYQD